MPDMAAANFISAKERRRDRSAVCGNCHATLGPIAYNDLLLSVTGLIEAGSLTTISFNWTVIQGW